jgi:MFS family permease
MILPHDPFIHAPPAPDELIEWRKFYGRRPIYLISLALFTIWLIPCAVAPNYGSMIAGRLLSGLTSAAFQSVAGGSISDLFTRETLQLPMMVYTATPFAGPVLGPMIGGFINYNTSWYASVSATHTA